MSKEGSAAEVRDMGGQDKKKRTFGQVTSAVWNAEVKVKHVTTVIGVGALGYGLFKGGQFLWKKFGPAAPDAKVIPITRAK